MSEENLGGVVLRFPIFWAVGRAPNKGSPEVESAILIGLFSDFQRWVETSRTSSQSVGRRPKAKEHITFVSTSTHTRIHSKNVCVNTIWALPLFAARPKGPIPVKSPHCTL